LPNITELKEIETYIYHANFEKALELISSLEEKNTASKFNLLLLILKGRLFSYQEKYRKAVEFGEKAISLSRELVLPVQSIDALLLKSNSVFLGDLEYSVDFINQAEKLINLTYENPALDAPRQYSDFLTIKFIVLRYASNLKESFKTFNEWLSLFEDSSEEIDKSKVYIQISESYLYDSKVNIALDYAKRSLDIQKNLENKIGIASSLYSIGQSHFVMGEIEESLDYFRKCLSFPEISVLTKLEAMHMTGAVFKEKGEINRALRYYKRSVDLARKEGYREKLASLMMSIGTIYRMKGESNIATEYLNQSLHLCREINSLYGISVNLFYLILIYLEKDLITDAQAYLLKLEKTVKQTQSSQWFYLYELARALIFKKTKRLKARSEAETILKEIIENGLNLTPQLRFLTIINLCDLLIEELVITNNDEILKELTPLINQLLNLVKNANSYLWLAETRLLQAKLALIQMNIRDAKKLMVEAQMIADIHGLNLLAIKISNEHDSLLDQSRLWDELLQTAAPYSERIKLASIDGLISQMQGKKTLEELQVIDETPILLLIMSKDGVPHFTHSFRKDWDFEFLFSSFLSAFNSFSSEIFSKTIDRIKIGENKILINPIKTYLICYVIQGQSYPAQKKLYQFTREIEQNPDILLALKRSVKTCRSLDLDNTPMLGSVVRKIFPQVKI
jgi:tetratricopeptide (TPR) repeat protein